MILSKIIKDELGEEMYNQMSDICNEPSPERRIELWMGKELFDAWNKILEEDVKNYFK